MISVIINVYNGEKYIKRCLDSIINQTYKNLDILIINDGSTDKTLSICKKYKDKRIRIINQQNKGLALSRNVGIENAKGDYLYFVDADDYIELDTIDYLYNLCKKYDALIATCKSIRLYNKNSKKNRTREKVKFINNKDFLKKILLKKDFSVTIWNKLIKKELFNDLRFNNIIINDMDFTHKLILKTDKIISSNIVKYYYWYNYNSISSKKASITRLTNMYDVYVNRFFYIRNIYPVLIENNYALLQLITDFYCKCNEQLTDFMDNNNSQKLFNDIFTYKIIFCNVKIKEKIKILLFKINHKLAYRIIKKYVTIMKGIKNDKCNNKCL